jgi:hypothetical protein
MGFIRQQEERVTKKFLIWRYQKLNIMVPPDSELQKQASKIVDDAHRVARERGSNVMEIIKELIGKYTKPE